MADRTRSEDAQALDADFAGYVSRRWPIVVRTAYLVCGDRAAAEDLAQGAFVRLHRHWRRVSAQGVPDAYVHRIVVNLAIRQARKLRHEVAEEQPPQAVAEDGYARVDQRDELWRALRRLPPRMRAVLVLRFFEHLTERETADALDCAVGTVKSQTAQGLQRLRGLLHAGDGVAAGGLPPGRSGYGAAGSAAGADGSAPAVLGADRPGALRREDAGGLRDGDGHRDGEDPQDPRALPGPHGRHDRRDAGAPERPSAGGRGLPPFRRPDDRSYQPTGAVSLPELDDTSALTRRPDAELS
ncbi:SigE family RNA polymerase sigma factor [Yinghuangia soli]|uniref:SigE family RNA polymerase sigma factor n=1 Tax=Yinghuangia soli TaxID=2908204 RepID=A0AA41U535_9ACTN|nr:SigE family RNA polymerase sigma factor [Yinghuangia soli]MCF2529589.1 SigE family RNA polymerase sigma factor [Yinghuangia soli]